MRKIIAIIAAFFLSFTLAAPASANGNPDAMGTKPNLRCAATKDNLSICKSWDTAIALRNQVSSLNSSERQAAVYAFWIQYEKFPRFGYVNASQVAQLSTRNDNCGKVIYQQTIKGIGRQYNIDRQSYDAKLWGGLAVSAGAKITPQKLASVSAKIVAGKIAASRVKKMEKAINAISPNPEAAALNAGIKIVSSDNAGFEMTVNKYGAIQTACGIW